MSAETYGVFLRLRLDIRIDLVVGSFWLLNAVNTRSRWFPPRRPTYYSYVSMAAGVRQGSVSVAALLDIIIRASHLASHLANGLPAIRHVTPLPPVGIFR